MRKKTTIMKNAPHSPGREPMGWFPHIQPNFFNRKKPISVSQPNKLNFSQSTSTIKIQKNILSLALPARGFFAHGSRAKKPQ